MAPSPAAQSDALVTVFLYTSCHWCRTRMMDVCNLLVYKHDGQIQHLKVCFIVQNAAAMSDSEIITFKKRLIYAMERTLSPEK